MLPLPGVGALRHLLKNPQTRKWIKRMDLKDIQKIDEWLSRQGVEVLAPRRGLKSGVEAQITYTNDPNRIVRIQNNRLVYPRRSLVVPETVNKEFMVSYPEATTRYPFTPLSVAIVPRGRGTLLEHVDADRGRHSGAHSLDQDYYDKLQAIHGGVWTDPRSGIRHSPEAIKGYIDRRLAKEGYGDSDLHSGNVMYYPGERWPWKAIDFGGMWKRTHHPGETIRTQSSPRQRKTNLLYD